MTYPFLVVFIETPIFFRRVQEYMEDEDYGAMQAFLMEYPDAGKLSKGPVVFENCVGPGVDVVSAAACG